MILSFGLMAWVFYELSGGSAFVPETRTEAAAPEQTVVLDRGAIDIVRIDEVSRADTDLTLATLTVPQASVAAPVQALRVPAPAVVIAAEPVATPVLETVAAPAAPAAPDLRVVAGSLVNMRDGPGIDYAVLSKVTGGTLAEVIAVDADGWARIRLVDSDQVGWMAERLLEGG